MFPTASFHSASVMFPLCISSKAGKDLLILSQENETRPRVFFVLGLCWYCQQGYWGGVILMMQTLAQ